MSFTCAGGETGQLIDALPIRRLPRLASYLSGCANPEEVRFLITDMNTAYFQLIKHIPPNTKIVIDRFHIIEHMNQAFNELRIRETNELRKVGQESQTEKLKKDWRSLLKNYASISHYECKTQKSFQAPKYPFLTEVMMINRLLGFSTSLKEVYPYLRELAEAFRDKDSDLFFSLLAELPETLDNGPREKL